MLWSMERLPLSLCLGPEMGARTEPHIRLCTQQGACLSFASPSPSLLLLARCPVRALSLSLKNKKGEKKASLGECQAQKPTLRS